MKKLKINRLDWDTSFFGFEVGQLVVEPNSYLDSDTISDFSFIQLKQSTPYFFEINGYENVFQETKVLFSKKLIKELSSFSHTHIKDSSIQSVKKEVLYPLAFESGSYSRYRLDSRFTENQFKELYMKWVDNSLNLQFADKVFYLELSGIVLGFVTVKCHEDSASIGLIAVSPECQGKGYGSMLLKTVEYYCVSQNIFELRIPTQLENFIACNFYSYHGYTIFEKSILKHYWKI